MSRYSTELHESALKAAINAQHLKMPDKHTTKDELIALVDSVDRKTINPNQALNKFFGEVLQDLKESLEP